VEYRLPLAQKVFDPSAVGMAAATRAYAKIVDLIEQLPRVPTASERA